MILFQRDWAKYPGSIIDYETKNTSWIRLAGVLQSMGVQNHAFMLALHNPLLKGIDPYSDDLTMEQMTMIAVECKENPWYFFREVLRVPTPGAKDNINIRANRENISVWWLFFNHITSIVIAPRQTGKSVTIFGLDTYLLGVAGVSLDIHLLTKDDDLRMKSVSNIKEMLEDLPPYLKLKSKKDTYNTEKITIERLGNTYYTSVAQASPKAANNIGRGLTVACHRIDEFAFIKNIEITLPALLASASSARDSAKAHGSFYGNVFATTAGYLSSAEGRYAYKIYKDASRWDEHIFDCENLDHAIETIRRNSPGGSATVLCEYNHRQLGFTDEWLRQKIEDAMADGIKAEAEFLNIWPEGNESSPISKEHLKILHDNIVPDPYTTISKDGYITRWYISKIELDGSIHNRKLVMGLDTSDAIGNDDIAMCIRDAITGEVVATGIYNETNLITFANWLVEWVENYPNLTMIIERRSSGVTIIDNLLTILPNKRINPFRRLFNWVTNNAPENPKFQQELQYVDNYFDIDTINKYRKEFGYATSGSGRASRDNLYGSAFTSMIKYSANVIRDRTLVDQLSSLVRKNDRIDHPDGGHDDLCFTGDMLIRTINGNKKIKDIRIGDMVLTRKGYKPIIAIYKRKAPVISKYGLTGTKEHPFITPNGIVEFQNINNNTEVYKWDNQKKKLLSIMAKDIIGIQTHQEDILESITGDMINGKNHRLLYIGNSISIILAIFLKVTKSITQTVTRLIMNFQIWNVSTQKHIKKNTQYLKKQEKNLENVVKEMIILENGGRLIQRKQENMRFKMVSVLIVLKNGGKKTQKDLDRLVLKPENLSKIEQRPRKNYALLDLMKKIKNYMQKWGKKTDLKEEADQLGIQQIQKKLNSIEKILDKQLLKEKKEKDIKENMEIVYNLTVKDCHEYFVNDILVHNCIASLLSWFLLHSGKNLQYYGLNPQHVLLTVSDAELEEKGGREAVERKDQQTKLYNEVEAILNQAKSAITTAEKEQLVRRAKFMAKDLDMQSVNTLNLDGMIKNMRLTTNRLIVPSITY